MKGFAKPKNLSWTLLDGKLVILDSREEKKFHEFNGLATDLWRWIDEVEGPTELVNKTLEKYDVLESVAQQDINLFVQSLVDKKLLERE